MSKTARFLWLTEILEIKSNDQILEIGCGVGLAVEQIASRLEEGFITAIDRSQPMISKAMLRNAKFVEEKKAEFVLTDLNSFSGGGQRFNKIFASNVNLFWTKRSITAETGIVRSHLAKKGRLYLFYQPPSPDGMKRVTEAVADNLRKHGFDVMDTVYDKTVSTCCIISAAR